MGVILRSDGKFGQYGVPNCLSAVRSVRAII